MSDLQCPARILLVTEVGEQLTAWLGDERVALVYDGSAGRSAATAEEVAAALAVSTRPLEQAVDVRDVLARRPDALAELCDLADLHRGETVLVLARGQGRGPVRVSIDGDGVVVGSAG